MVENLLKEFVYGPKLSSDSTFSLDVFVKREHPLTVNLHEWDAQILPFVLHSAVTKI